MQEIWVQPLGWEDPLEMEIATHSSILAWEIPWTEEPGGPQSMGFQKSDMTKVTKPPPPRQSWSPGQPVHSVWLAEGSLGPNYK